MRSIHQLILKIMGYKLWRAIGKPRLLPINVTVSVTNMCNSKCKTCFLWKFYQNNLGIRESELKVHEYDRIFESLDEAPFWVTISGGEPFLRKDLPRICESLVYRCKPSIISIPSNGLLSKIIEDRTKRILEKISDTNLIINLSLDGTMEKHDEIRGVPGNFERLLETYRRLKLLREKYPFLRVGIHTVISILNIEDILDIYEYAKGMKPDSYITEVAEERAELFNNAKGITPSSDAYTEVIDELCHRLKADYLHSKKRISRITQAFRLEYYKIAAQELRERRQIIPCYAGYASCQITPFGDVWPCCVLGYTKVMGNLRESNYNFQKVWFSEKAEEIRTFIRGGNCACPLANAHYTSMFCNFNVMARTLTNLVW